MRKRGWKVPRSCREHRLSCTGVEERNERDRERERERERNKQETEAAGKMDTTNRLKWQGGGLLKLAVVCSHLTDEDLTISDTVSRARAIAQSNC